MQVALAHPHLRGIGYDLAPIAPIFADFVAACGVQDRLHFQAGDFFHDPLPAVDVLVMGHILHDWGLDDKRALVAKAYAALPDGGALLVYESMIDDERRTNAFGLLMSLNMLIETPAGFDYTPAQCVAWMKGGPASGDVQRAAGPPRDARRGHLVGHEERPGGAPPGRPTPRA